VAAVFKKKKKKLMTIMIIMTKEKNVWKERMRDVEEELDTDGGEGRKEIDEDEYKMKKEGMRRKGRRI
jgi:hypothetical protein